jgi:glycosyltransferase involved in cell wall biosynthesis
MEKLSVVIIAFNEEKKIGACLDSVLDIADDILVLDSFSTDKTEEIVRSKGARFEQHVFDGHIQQKNRAITYARYPFVLSLDADEQLDENLRTSIRKIKENKTADGYTMNRLNFYCGKPVRTCGWYPDRKLRLWDSSKGAWGGTNPHDRYEMQEGAVIGHLQGDILHDTYSSLQELQRTVEKFSTIGALQLREKSLVYLCFKLLVSPPVKFLRNYFLRLGFTDGSAGWTICKYQVKEVSLKYYKAIRLKFES